MSQTGVVENAGRLVVGKMLEFDTDSGDTPVNLRMLQAQINGKYGSETRTFNVVGPTRRFGKARVYCISAQG